MQHSQDECNIAPDGTFHVGVIMDGNGRWAEARGLNRIAGHARGARRVSELVAACPGLGVTHLTLYVNTNASHLCYRSFKESQTIFFLPLASTTSTA